MSLASQENKAVAKTNMSILKKTLTDPKKFRESRYENKACFSHNWKQYGYVETWDIAWNLMKCLPEGDNTFNELITETHKVKPYLDVEWIKEDYPNYNPDIVKMKIKKCLVYIFKNDFDISLNQGDVYFTKCHRQKKDGFKYSFHVIVSTHKPMIVFQTSKDARYLANRMRDIISEYIDDTFSLIETEDHEFIDYKFNPSIIDIGVYGKTQNMRLPGQSKKEEFAPMLIDGEETPLEYIITNVDKYTSILEVDEQADNLVNDIKNNKNVKFTKEHIDDILNKVKLYHPTAYYEKTDDSGFLQFNYTDRSERCFTGDIFHDKIGFFAYINKNNQIILGCHSGNCIKENSKTDITVVKKAVKDIGTIEEEQNLTFEQVHYNNTFDINPSFVKECILNGAIGISNLFEKMYLYPKRIKWIDDTKLGSSYFWDGKKWQEDNYSFIERLLVSTVVKLLRDWKKKYNEDHDLKSDENDEIVKIAEKMIKQLNDGILINNILKFIKPLIRDSDFSKIKDIHPYELACKNGMVDLKTGELRPAVPEDNITKTLETSYNKDADYSVFDLFIRQITSTEEGENKELYDFFKWCIGYSMQGSPKKKLFLILYGPHGFNGKSLAMNTIKEVLEYYAVAMDSSVVLDNGSKKTAGAHATQLMQLENGRLGLLSDTSEGAVLDDGQVKQLTGITDKISAREIFGKQREFTPTFVPIISTNHPIQVNLADKAMYERLILFPFVLSFVDNPKAPYERKNNPSLSEIFQKEKAGILRWLVEASIYYNENQDKEQPQIILDAKEKYNKQVNVYVDFVDITFIKTTNEEDKISKTELIEQYKAYMQQNGMYNKCKPKVAEREFDKMLKVKETKNKKYYTHIKYKDDDIEEDDELN